jgi:hypothetical protein
VQEAQGTAGKCEASRRGNSAESKMKKGLMKFNWLVYKSGGLSSSLI